MKKPLLIIAALICVIIAGCKIDESGVPQTQSNPLLIGTWYIKSQSSVDPISSITATKTNFTVKDYYTFNVDNTLKISTSLPDTVVNSRFAYSSDATGQRVVLADAYDSGFVTYTISKLTTDSLIMSSVATVPFTYKLAHR